jgi:hypothetical protein
MWSRHGVRARAVGVGGKRQKHGFPGNGEAIKSGISARERRVQG